MPAVKALIEQQILLERERCAARARVIAYREQIRGNKSESATAYEIEDYILHQSPPHIKLVRPETAVTKPEVLDEHTIIAGIGLHPVTDEIIDRERLQRIDMKSVGIGVTSNGTILRTR